MRRLLLLGFISSICLFFTEHSLAQDTLSNKTAKNAVTYILPKALTFGVDISYPVRYAFDQNVKAFEAVADLRLNNKLYVAAEAGYAEAKYENTYLAYNSTGPYMKAGVNYNVLKSKKPTNNSVYVGGRLVFSSVSSDVTDYVINQPKWPDDATGSFSVERSSVYSFEVLLGLKVEVVKNFIMGYSIRGAFPIVNKEPEGFDNLYIPGLGFRRNFMFNFNYTLSYMLPLGKVKNQLPIQGKK